MSRQSLSVSRLLSLLLLAAVAGCATTEPRRGVNYPAASPAPQSAPAAPSRPEAPPAPPREWRAVGAGLDAGYERGTLLRETFYANPDLLLQQVEGAGAMGVNRAWLARGGRETNAFLIEEQRFADTIVGAGVNQQRQDLLDAGLRAIEWGFEKQRPDGGFPGADAYVGGSYFLAAAAHSVWLLEATGYANRYARRIDALRPALARTADWLLKAGNARAASADYDQSASRYFITAYALGLTGRLLNEPSYALAAEDWLRAGLGRQDTAGYFPERGGYDASYQAEALVYLLRYYDHVATADMRRTLDAPLQKALSWLESRVTAKGIVQTKGNTRTGFGQERDRTGAYRRISTVAISRAFGLAQAVLGKPQYAARARAVATAREPS